VKSVRRSAKEYKLKPDENLRGPLAKYEIIKPTGRDGKCSLSESWLKYCSLYTEIAVGSNRKLNADEKAVQRALFKEIIAFWPNSDFDEEKAKGR